MMHVRQVDGAADTTTCSTVIFPKIYHQISLNSQFVNTSALSRLYIHYIIYTLYNAIYLCGVYKFE